MYFATLHKGSGPLFYVLWLQQETRSRGLRPLSRSLYPFARLFEARSRARPSHIGRNDATSGTPLGSPMTRNAMTRHRDFFPSFFLFLFSFSFCFPAFINFISVGENVRARDLTRFDQVYNYYTSKKREWKRSLVLFSFFIYVS